LESTAPPHVYSPAEFGCCTLDGAGVIKIFQKKLTPHVQSFMVPRGHWNWHGSIRATCEKSDFLL